MSIYGTKILKDSDGLILKTAEGKTLRVVDKNKFTAEGIDYIIRRPISSYVFRFYVLNEDETIDYEIPQEDIVIDKTTYSESYQQGVRRTMVLTLVNMDGKYTPNINGIWMNTKLRFDVGIKFEDTIKWYQKGIYVISDPTLSYTLSDKSITFQLVDKFHRLIGKTGILESTYEVPVNSDIKMAIEGVLKFDYGSYASIDSKPIIFDNVFEGATTPYTLTKDANSTWGDLIVDLAYMLNAECYYNEYGNLCIVSMREATADYNKPILWHFKKHKNDGLEYDNLNIRYDYENAVNEINVVGDNVNGDIFSAKAENTSMMSPLNINLIGRRVSLITDSNISSDTQAEDRAQYELRNASILSTNISFNIYLIPFLSVNTIVEMDNDFLEWNSELLLIKEISFSIGSSGIMSLSCANIDNLPFVI